MHLLLRGSAQLHLFQQFHAFVQGIQALRQRGTQLGILLNNIPKTLEIEERSDLRVGKGSNILLFLTREMKTSNFVKSFGEFTRRSRGGILPICLKKSILLLREPLLGIQPNRRGRGAHGQAVHAQFAELTPTAPTVWSTA